MRMLIVTGIPSVCLKKQSGLRIAALLLMGCVSLGRAQATDVDFQGVVVDQKGAPVPGATVKLLESALIATTDADGKFALKGTVAIGILMRTRLPGNLRLEYKDGMLILDRPVSGGVKAEWISPNGGRKELQVTSEGGNGKLRVDLDRLVDTGGKPANPRKDGNAGLHWIRISSTYGSSLFRFVGNGAHGVLAGGPGYSGEAVAIVNSLDGGNIGGAGSGSKNHAGVVEKAGASVKAVAGGFVLEASATGLLTKRFAQDGAVKAGLTLALLPAAAGLKERIQDFIGAGNSLRLAFLKPEAAGSRKFLLYYVDFAEMSADTMPQHVFPDSRGPSSSPYGAFAPSWSPDGRTIAYETGYENLTTPISRVYLQPISGVRVDGPVYPATNPRWWTDGKDTDLVWCSSGREDAWADTASATYRQKISAGALSGAPETLSKGSYNAGLSPDGRYLAAAYRYALMQDLQDKGKRYLHVYPGHPKAQDGVNTDSLQACNGSVSQDPAHPSRMLFLDFGVTDPPGYDNIVRPALYAQHRMILIGDYASDAAGRIVDFIDTPAAELAVENTWDDPEWTTHPDFAVATTRDPDGDKTVPTEPKPTQPDIYLIKLSTKETLKVFSGGHQLLPVAWIGPKN